MRRAAVLVGLVACVPAPAFNGQTDGAVDGAVDDGPIGPDAFGEWSTPIKVPNINSAGMDGCPFVTADGKEMYLASDRAGGGRSQIYRSTFTTGVGWSQPIIDVTFSPPMWNVTRPILSSNGLTMYFAVSVNGGNWSVYLSDRVTTAATWTMPVSIPQLSRLSPEWAFPGSLVGADDKAMYLAQQQGTDPSQIMTATLEGNTWGNLTEVNDLDSPGADELPWVDSTATMAIFTSNRADPPNGSSLFVATRTAATVGWSTPVGMSVNMQGARDLCAMATVDGRTLYFSSNRNNSNVDDFDIYVSTR